jgi:hypothetical protein
MIEGLKLDISSEELKNHLSKKIAHHKERERFYAEQVASLTKGGVQPTNYSGGDPVRALKEKEERHTSRAELLTFLRDHLIPDQTYRLTEQDLVSIEIVSRFW